MLFCSVLCGNMFPSINEVTVHQTQLILGFGNCLWAGKPSRYILRNQSPRLTQPPTPPVWLGLRLGVFTCIGWKVTLCDLIRQVTPCTSEIEFHLQLHMTFSHLNFNQTDEKHYRRHSLKTFQFLPVFLCVFFVTI